MTESATVTAPAHLGGSRLGLTLGVLAAATFWTVTAEMLPSGLLTIMSRDLGVPGAAVGSLVSVWGITIAVVSIPLVRLTLRAPRTLLLAVSLALTAPANLVTALAPGLAIALTGRILAAAAHGLFWALVVSYLGAIVAPARLGRALAIVLAGPTLAGLVGLPLAALVAAHAGWRPVFSALSVLLALTAVAVRLALPTVAGHRGHAPSGTWDHSARTVLVTAGGGGLVLVGHFATFTYVTILVTGLGGFTIDAAPGMLLVLGVTGGLGVLVSGVAADRWPRVALIGAAAAIVVGLGLVLLGDHRPALFTTGLAVWGFAIGAFPPILQTRVLRQSSSAFRPLAGSLVVTVLNLGVAAGAAFGGAALGVGVHSLVLAALLTVLAGTVILALGGRPAPTVPGSSVGERPVGVSSR